MPVIIPNIPFIARRRVSRTPPAPPPPVVGPVLVSAAVDAENALLELSFDRAIDVSGFVPGAIVVLDAVTVQELGGTADTNMTDPNTVRITLIVNGEYAGEGTRLTATGGAGIVASDDASPWAGVSDSALPFP